MGPLSVHFKGHRNASRRNTNTPLTQTYVQEATETGVTCTHSPGGQATAEATHTDTVYGQCEGARTEVRTVEHVHPRGGDLQVRGPAHVDPGVVHVCLLHLQDAGDGLLRQRDLHLDGDLQVEVGGVRNTVYW